jgi:carbon monoxide dehydrogenase subunit G
MEINDSFRVDLPVEETWRVLMDIERIAPCLPGAQLQEIAGEEYRGVVKVKVGPITAQYKGAASFESRDDVAHVAVIKGSGRDTRGQGNASATITMRLEADGDGTAVSVSTDLAITGKVAQFGRGVMADVSAKLLAQFVANLERDVLSEPAVDLVAAAAEDAAAGATPPAATGTPSSTPAAVSNDPALSGPPTTNGALKTDAEVTVRTIDSPETEPVDLLEMGGSPLLKRLVPLVVVAVVLAVVVVARRRRRHRSAS